jgi:hypothetical protein
LLERFQAIEGGLRFHFLIQGIDELPESTVKLLQATHGLFTDGDNLFTKLSGFPHGVGNHGTL